MKIKIGILIMILAFVFGCKQNKMNDQQITKKGMIKVTVLYPNGEGKTFDMVYYSSKHIPLVKRLFGKAMKDAAIDKGVAGGTPDTQVPYLAIGHLYFETMSAYQEGIKTHLEEILADIPKYTNITPVIQISEVIQ